MTSPTPRDTEPLQLLDAIFRQGVHGAHSESFAQIAMALEAGVPVQAVVVACFAASEALADPERRSKIRARAAARLGAVSSLGRQIKDNYKGMIRTGTVVEDLDTHWRVDWGPNRTRIRKDRVGKRPKKQGPWWSDPLDEVSQREQRTRTDKWWSEPIS